MREFKTTGDNPTGCLLQLWEQDFLLINCRLIFIKKLEIKRMFNVNFLGNVLSRSQTNNGYFLSFAITATFINLFHLQKNLHTEIIKFLPL